MVHSGRWYLAAHDHLRDDLRTFRVDRMQRMRVVAEPALAPPDGFDAVAYVSTSLARVPWPWEIEVVLDLAVDEAARRVPATLAELVETDGGRCSGCASVRSTGRQPCSPDSAAALPFASPRSFGQAFGR